jgi:hypothetical protein
MSEREEDTPIYEQLVQETFDRRFAEIVATLEEES